MVTGIAQALLGKLLTYAYQPPRVYVHQWRVGDVLVWDDRCVLHRAAPWNLSGRRVMRHVRVAGEVHNLLS
jgi:alpha-ketoglutarate-dependent taurine dioxygenase